MPTTPSRLHYNQPPGRLDGWRTYLLSLLRLTSSPTVSVYRSFGTDRQVTVQGHVLQVAPRPQRHYQHWFLGNLVDMVRQFLVQPIAHAHVQVVGCTTLHSTDADGFFQFDWQPDTPLLPGWHLVQINLVSSITDGQVVASGTGEVYVPHGTQYGFISDIDDTFLISHSATKWRRLWVLLFRNAHGRRPFAGVVAHYQALYLAGTTPEQPNPFFYVSSSEWNLYAYLVAFLDQHKFPKGVLMLSQLKRFDQLTRSGQDKHITKLDRIARILDRYPTHRFILLGDDTQADPGLYTTVVAHHPGQIRCVYIRQVGSAPKLAVSALLTSMETAGVACCYFRHSAEALHHSAQLGLV